MTLNVLPGHSIPKGATAAWTAQISQVPREKTLDTTPSFFNAVLFGIVHPPAFVIWGVGDG